MDALIKLGIYSQIILPNYFFTRFTKNNCTILGKNRKLKIRLRFAKKYNIDYKKAERYNEGDDLETFVKKYKNLNALFQRKLKKIYTLPQSKKIDDIISPAEAFVRYIYANKTFKIKKIEYTLSKLLKIDDDKNELNKATIYIFRLAPEHYHRIHSPIVSKIISIKSAGGNYKSVNPIILNSSPVLQENFRKIIKFENDIYLVAVGATCIGSIDLSVKEGDKIKHGQDMGAFGFGGSCIVLVIPYKIVEKYNFITKKEKYIEPCTIISKFSY